MSQAIGRCISTDHEMVWIGLEDLISVANGFQRILSVHTEFPFLVNAAVPHKDGTLAQREISARNLVCVRDLGSILHRNPAYGWVCILPRNLCTYCSGLIIV